MIFILGYLAGIITTVAILLLDIYLFLRKGSFVDRLLQQVQTRAGPKAVVVAPPTPAQEAFESLPKDKDIKFEIND